MCCVCTAIQMCGLYSKENHAPQEDMLSFSSFPKNNAEIIWNTPVAKPQSVNWTISEKHAVLCSISYWIHSTSYTNSKTNQNKNIIDLHSSTSFLCYDILCKLQNSQSLDNYSARPVKCCHIGMAVVVPRKTYRTSK